jgi:hypothetical protein
VVQGLPVAQQRGLRASAVIVLVCGIVALALGIGCLALAEHYKPSVENLLVSEGEVFSSSTYNAVKTVGWILVIGGGIGAIAGIVMMNRSPTQLVQAPVHAPPPPSSLPPPPPPSPVESCERCGGEIDTAHRFCPYCGYERSQPFLA